MRITALAGVILAASTAHAAVVTFQQNVGGYTGTRDTELRFIEPDLNTGSATSLSIDADDGPGPFNPTHGLLSFDGIIGSGPGQVPAGSLIVRATLHLEVISAGSGMNFHRMIVDWSESAATWNSFGAGVQADGVEAAVAATLSVGANDGNGNIPSGPFTADLTADVQAWAGGAANFGWAILPFVPDGTNGTDFFSSEATGTLQPRLTVEYIPEPAAVGVLGMLGVAGLRRRAR